MIGVKIVNHHVKQAAESSDQSTDACEPHPMSGVSNRTEGRRRLGRAEPFMRTLYEVEELSCSTRGSEES